MAGEALVTVVLLVGPPFLATRLTWPLGEHTTWTWLGQYLRGGTVPDEVVIASLLVALWGIWAVHLVIVALDIVAVARGVAPRVGLVRLVWVLVAGGTAATTTHATALAAHSDAAVEVPVAAEPASGEENTESQREQAQDQDTIDRTRVLAGFGFDSADLTPTMAESLEPTIGMIADFGHSEAPVVITGHTDPVGDPHHNQALSEQRAQAVADHLAGHLDADVQIEVQGKAAAQPPSNPHASHGEYRRIEISYTVQRPTPTSTPAPTPPAESEPDDLSEADLTPEKVRLDAGTENEQNTPLDTVMVGAASGLVGLGAGYVAGRMCDAGKPRRRDPEGEPTTAPDGESATDDVEPAGDGLVRQDAAGTARGVIDDDGYVLVSDRLWVNSAGGVALVGEHAARVLAALVADHAPGPVVATSSAATSLAAHGAPLSGVQVVPDLARVQVAVEAALLTRARHQDEDGDDASGSITSGSPVLVAVQAGDLGTDQGLPASLTTTPGVVVCVLGPADHVETELDCSDTDQVRVRTRDGEVAHDSALRHWSPPSVEGEREPSSDDQDSGSALGHPSDADEDEADQPEEEEQSSIPVVSEADPHPRARVTLFAQQLMVQVDGQEVSGLRTVARTLLAFLAMRPGGASAEEIAQECFATVEPTRMVSARKNAMTSLRSSVRGALGDPDHPVIMRKNGRYALDATLFSVDLWDFSAAHKRSEELAGKERIRAWEDIVRLHGEPLLGKSGEPWSEPVRKSCIRVVVEALVAISENTFEGEEKVRILGRALRFDEFNEPLYQRMMETHVSLGRPEVSHQFYRLLKEKLSLIGETPNRESQAIGEGRVRPVR